MSESPRLEAQVLAAHTLGISRTSLLAHPQELFPQLAGESLLQRREVGEPLAYILGKREFYGRDFIVRKGVLIPRQDTETLVEVVLDLDLDLDLPQDARVLDVGVGSGCIGITIALERPEWVVSGSDISPLALDIASENAERLGSHVEFLEGDLLTPFAGETFDLIVSNPPYIEASEELAHEVRGWEPPEALFALEDGLQFYRRLAQEAADRLNPGGWLAVEVGHTQASLVKELFRTNDWDDVRSFADLSGIQRVVVARNRRVERT